MVEIEPDDRDLIARCLHAAVDGPYFPEWEFRILFGLERDEVRRVSARWPPEQVDGLTRSAVYESILHLWGYPHGKEEQLLRELEVDDRDDLRDLLHRWRTATTRDVE